MTGEANGQRKYRVTLSGMVRELFRDLHEQTIAQGRGAAFVSAFRTIADRLQHDPFTLGAARRAPSWPKEMQWHNP